MLLIIPSTYSMEQKKRQHKHDSRRDPSKKPRNHKPPEATNDIAKEPTNNSGQNVLMNAISRENFRLASYMILQKFQLNAVDNNGYSALVYVIDLLRRKPNDLPMFQKCRDIIELLLKAKIILHYHLELNGYIELEYFKIALKSNPLLAHLEKMYRPKNIKQLLKDAIKNQETAPLEDYRNQVTETLAQEFGDKQISCEFCHRSYSSKYISEHIISTHQAPIDISDESYNLAQNTNTSIPSSTSIFTDSSGNNKHKCNECSNSYNCRTHLEQHIQAQHKNIKYSCNQCNSSYKYLGDLRRHQREKHIVENIAKI